jgi:hypothetical protein
MFEDIDSDLDLPDTLTDDLVSESDNVELRIFWGQ